MDKIILTDLIANEIYREFAWVFRDDHKWIKLLNIIDKHTRDYKLENEQIENEKLRLELDVYKKALELADERLQHYSNNEFYNGEDDSYGEDFDWESFLLRRARKELEVLKQK